MSNEYKKLESYNQLPGLNSGKFIQIYLRKGSQRVVMNLYSYKRLFKNTKAHEQDFLSVIIKTGEKLTISYSIYIIPSPQSF